MKSRLSPKNSPDGLLGLITIAVIANFVLIIFFLTRYLKPKAIVIRDPAPTSSPSVPISSILVPIPKTLKTPAIKSLRSQLEEEEKILNSVDSAENKFVPPLSMERVPVLSPYPLPTNNNNQLNINLSGKPK